MQGEGPVWQAVESAVWLAAHLFDRTRPVQVDQVLYLLAQWRTRKHKTISVCAINAATGLQWPQCFAEYHVKEICSQNF